jgi:hypothetical protein
MQNLLMPKCQKCSAALCCEAAKRGEILPLAVNLTPQDISISFDPTYVDPNDLASSITDDEEPPAAALSPISAPVPVDLETIKTIKVSRNQVRDKGRLLVYGVQASNNAKLQTFYPRSWQSKHNQLAHENWKKQKVACDQHATQHHVVFQG